MQEDRRALEALEVPKFDLSLGVLRPFDLSMGNLTGDLGDLAEYLADFRKVLGNGTDNQDILRLTSDLVTEFGDRLQAANLANLDFGDQREVLAFIANLTERTDLVERLANLTNSEVNGSQRFGSADCHQLPPMATNCHQFPLIATNCHQLPPNMITPSMAGRATCQSRRLRSAR